MNFLEKYQKLVSEGIDKNQFTAKPTELYDPLNYILSHGGKRLRPVMALMAADLFGGDLQKALKPALAIEFFHNFTLIHDDIMDEAPLRRNHPTIHTLHGVNTGILSGDALMIQSYRLFEDLEPELFKKVLTLFSKTGVQICEGQQLDVNFETQDNVKNKDYLTMISYKTGVLCAAALQIGAWVAGASDEDAENLYQYGINVGVAFQIMDDYLDVFGDQEKFGKKHAGDIFENKKTILYLLAQKYANEEEKKELDFWYSKKTDNVDKIYGVEKIFRKIKVDEKVQQLIEKYNQKAQKYLDRVSIEDSKKQPFVQLAEYLLNRNI
ncbi:polyprenyl synthetase family protein [Elizabethkingia sp. JS20170427COW]|uniref:polyprenyl synthetase family protein n=1 Tax=Elizabethkingia sp. JS20170427COW TaxID=2583851 RepID=UPI001110963C|nr:polyprenyl synthetase family protein [Elizabethkingia sp. JS20170427COW]QCX54062.1 polyprenyl synthetase family protein [Elizabethkingia sp. JS20170427COW]